MFLAIKISVNSYRQIFSDKGEQFSKKLPIFASWVTSSTNSGPLILSKYSSTVILSHEPWSSLGPTHLSGISDHVMRRQKPSDRLMQWKFRCETVIRSLFHISCQYRFEQAWSSNLLPHCVLFQQQQENFQHVEILWMLGLYRF